MTILLTGNDLTLAEFERAILQNEPVALADEARERIEAARAVIDRIAASEQTAYGVNTGFGELARVRIPHADIRRLQLNLVRSHACGVGAPLTETETRAMLLLRANALAKGRSGARVIVVETLCAMLERSVLPVIPSQGSVGASGDLAPLAHLALVAIGEGEAVYRGERLPGAEAMRRAGIAPLELEAKEGLALLNGTQGMLALLSLALIEAEILADTADVATALSLDALRGTPSAFDERIALARPHPGALRTARNVERLNRGSQIRESHRAGDRDPRVQDAYSLRCTPQVHGAVRDAIADIRRVVEIEMNSATDNPLVFSEQGDVVSGGNFHGQPLAMAADQLAVAIATLAGISERRIDRMTNPHSSMLPAFLTEHPGLNSGFMMAQVTAAALVSETKVLAAPHSVDSIPTSGDQEDYVSMGMSAARRLRPMFDNLRHILAIELLAACQGIDLLAPLHTGTEAERARQKIRSVVPKYVDDRPHAPDIAAVAALIAASEFANVLR
ncbi:MAG: histidine ammonia-lyase [Acidobacteriota bacterium]|nr:histidine ammonia-lyase [Acidobacteriota bacterium]